MGMRNTLDGQGGGVPPVDKMLGNAADAVGGLSAKLPTIVYLEENIDQISEDIQSAEAAAALSASTAAAAILTIDASKQAAADSAAAAAKSVTDVMVVQQQAASNAADAASSAAILVTAVGAAQTSEQNATVKAQDAATSAAAAKISQDAAAASATSAATSAQTATQAIGGSVGDATAAKTAALTAATNAKTSETNASASAAAALASQNAAKTSETNAKTSETNGKTSETNAKTSETNAGTSATSASSSLAQAQAIVATLNQLNLGPHATDPVKDNAGNNLIIGAEYFNTTSNQMRVYTSNGWQDVDATSETMAANATASASAASGSAAAALASQNAAKTSETNSKTSETNSKTSETNSKTSETNAAASATSAGTSKTAAANSATAAGTSATNAATSESNALTYKNAAQAAANAVAVQTIAKGGTGATDAATARTNLGVPGTDYPQFTNDVTTTGESPSFILNDTTDGGGYPQLLVKKAGVQQWGLIFDLANNGITLNRYGADGSFLDKPLIIDWWTGEIDLSQRPYFAGNVAYDSANLPPFSGKNRIINGDMRVAQRASASVTASQTMYGPCDRWRCANGTSGTIALSQNTTLLDENGLAKPFLVAGVTTVPSSIASSSLLQALCQLIEGWNSYDLIGKPVTLSFTVRSSVAGTFCASLRDGVSGISCVKTFNIAAAATGQRISLAFPAIPASANIPKSTSAGLVVNIGSLNTGTYQASAADTWLSGNFLTVAGLTNWASAVNGSLSITDVQLEVGTAATTFERRQYSQELALCQRYYVAGELVGVIGNAYSASTYVGGYTPLPVTMRANPTITWGTATENTNVSSVNIGSYGGRMLRVYVQNTSPGSVIYTNTYTANAEL